LLAAATLFPDIAPVARDRLDMPKRQSARPSGATDALASSGAAEVEFSTAQWPEHLRRFAANEFYAGFVNCEIEPLPDHHFHLEGKIRRLPGLGIVWGASSGLRGWRRASQIGSDAIMVNLNLAGERWFNQRGETRLRAGEARVMLETAPCGLMTGAPTRYVGLAVPRRALAPRLLAAKNSIIPAGDDALALLRSYLATMERAPPATLAVQRLAVAHVHDLVTMLLGATGDDAALARGRGVRAARLAAIKNDIAARLTQPSLSVATVAQRHRISPRYLHRLFEEDGTTFGAFVLGLRLLRAEQMLSDPRCGDRSISAIGYDAGFGDLSYFYRSFRRRFGATPADLRAAAAGNVTDHAAKGKFSWKS
jgi:AraC-like DNA-binding protein